MVVLGRRHGRPVVVKALCTEDPFWREVFAREIRTCRAMTERPPPVRVPKMVHTDASARPARRGRHAHATRARRPAPGQPAAH